MGNKQPSLLDVSMDLKFTSRQLERQSVKLEQSEKGEMKRIKDVSVSQGFLPFVVPFTKPCLIWPHFNPLIFE